MFSLSITDKRKKDLFINLFSAIKMFSSQINLKINEKSIQIQGMDKAHVSLYKVCLNNEWFQKWDVSNNQTICFDASLFISIINSKSDEQTLTLSYDGSDYLNINFFNEGEVMKKTCLEKNFKLPLLEYDYDEMDIPIIEYDVELLISSKKIADVFSQMSNFGESIKFKCGEDNVEISTKSDVSGEMSVMLGVEDVESFSTIEGCDLVQIFSQNYLGKLCISSKLSPNIYFGLSDNSPLKICYELGEESNLIYYIAPKIAD